MKASAEPYRQVKWTESALHDLQVWKFTKGEFKAIRAELERVAQVRNLDCCVGVVRVAQCNYEWFRLKLTEPCQIRVFFVERGNPPALVVQAVLHRSQRTYDLCQIIFEKAS